MPSALLWAYLAEKIFLVLQLRKICGFSGVAFSPEGLWRGVASAAASLWLSRSGSRSIFTAREPSQALRASSPEGRAFWQCGKVTRHETKLPPRGKANPLSLVALLLASSPEGRAFWQCGKVGRHEVKLPPRERLPPAGGRWRSQKGEQLARRQP